MDTKSWNLNAFENRPCVLLTPSTRVLQKYVKIYNEVNDFYKNLFCSIPKACNKLHISVNQYYRICKILHEPSIASQQHIPVEPSQDRLASGYSSTSRPTSTGSWIDYNKIKDAKF